MCFARSLETDTRICPDRKNTLFPGVPIGEPPSRLAIGGLFKLKALAVAKFTDFLACFDLGPADGDVYPSDDVRCVPPSNIIRG